MSNCKEDIWVISIADPLFYGTMYANLINQNPEKFSYVIELPHPYTTNLKKLFKTIRYGIEFYGFKGFCYGFFASALAQFRGQGDLKKVATSHGIPYAHISSLKELQRTVGGERPDTVLASVMEKISSEILDIAKNGWINTHCGALPQYAGMDAPFWTMYNKEPVLTVCLHYMNEEYDEGPIITQRSVKNEGAYFILLDALFKQAKAAHLEFLTDGYPKMRELPKQTLEGCGFYKKPTADMGQEFRRAGGRFI